MEKHLQHQRDLFHNFIDFEKAFDGVWHAGLGQVLRNFNIEEGLVQAIQTLYENFSSAVLLNRQPGEFFNTTVGVCQVCLLSTILFNVFLEKRTHSMTTTHPSQFVENPHATYGLPTTLILWATAMVNFKTSLTDS